VLLVVGAWAALRPTLANEVSSADLAEHIAAFSEPLEADGMLSGSLLVAQDGQVVYRASYGMANYELAVPNTADTRFCIASLSKPMTALVVARLVHEQRLNLDDAVSTWIGDFPSGDDISLRHLMTHRAGVPHRVTEPDEEVVPMTAQDIVERIQEKGLLAAPGEARVYSTAGYSVVARIIEIVTGQSYDDAMRELLFAPLGMERTSHVDNGFVLENRASSYFHGAEGIQNARLKDLSFLVGGGSLHSTVDDVFRFGRACLNRDALPEPVFEIFTQELGWMGSTPVRWNGSTNSFACFLDLHPDANLIVVFLGNVGLGRASVLRSGVPAIVAGEPYETPSRFPAQVALTASQLDEYVGTYGAAGRQSVLVGRDGILFSEGGGILRFRGDGKFYSPYYGCDVEFERDADGVIQALVYVLPGGGSLRFPRQ
jgi:CubicO group peptidase (beta-lactamase class C family)